MLMHALAANCEELRAMTGNPPLRAGKITIFEPKVVIFTARNTNNFTKLANFTGPYILHFTTFSNQSLQFYSF